MSNILKKIYLNNLHQNYNAKFVPFAGYSMPINYSEGIIKEHIHTRKFSSIFDVSHMGQILIPYSSYNISEISQFIPLDFNDMNFNKSHYSFILNDNGGIIDDIIISRIKYENKDFLFVVYNCSRRDPDEKIFFSKTKNAKILSNNSMIALQGPLSSKIISQFNDNVIKLKFMEVSNFVFMNNSIIISRTGYTGEDGFELSIPNNIVSNFVNELLEYNDIKLSGLGSRDSLRIEAGLSLYGNELNEKLTPVQSDLLWAISKKRLEEGNFNGHEKIINQIKNNDFNKRLGIIATNKSMIRSNMKLFNDKNVNIGLVTSGGYSPILNKSIGIVYINKIFNDENNKVFCLIRNKMEEVKVCKLPFIKHNYHRGSK